MMPAFTPDPGSPIRFSRPIAIQDWFDPDDDEHLQSLEEYQRTGFWPQGFLPLHVNLPWDWSLQLSRRMAERWLRHRADVRSRALGAE